MRSTTAVLDRADPRCSTVRGAMASGNAERFKGFAEDCMAEYDLDGWKVPDLTDPGELSYHVLKK